MGYYYSLGKMLKMLPLHMALFLIAITIQFCNQITHNKHGQKKTSFPLSDKFSKAFSKETIESNHLIILDFSNSLIW